MLKKIIIAAVAVLALIAFLQQKSDAPEIKKKSDPIQTTKAAEFNVNTFSKTDPNSIWVVVNKKLPLIPLSYAPTDLTVPGVTMRVAGTQVRTALVSPVEQLFAAANQNGTPLRISSGYRSYAYQVGLYNGYVGKDGQVSADAQSARPGFSEHQTGLAVDVAPARGDCEVQVCFADTPAGKWLADNAYKFGFIIRYGNGLTPITGYDYEPWHLRYIGTDLADEMQRRNVKTLEEFFALPAAPNY